MTQNLHPHFEGIIDVLNRDDTDRFLDYVKEKPKTVILDNLVIDVEQLNCYAPCSTCHHKKKDRMFCCSDLNLEITPVEIAKIRKIHQGLVREYPEYRHWFGKRGDFWAYDDTFQRIVQKKKDQTCIFYQRERGRGFCIIHDYAEKQGWDHTEWKPMVCCLYPLMVYVMGDEILIGLIGKESSGVMEMPKRGKFCARKKGPSAEHLIVQTEKILTRMFGKKKYQRIRKEVLGE